MWLISKIKQGWDWVKRNVKKVLIGIGVIGIVTAAGITQLSGEKPFVYQTLNWEKPTTDAQWAEDVKQDGLNYRLDFELQQMEKGHEAKLIKQRALYDKAVLYPDAIRYEYVQQGIEEPELTKQVNERVAQYKYEYERLQQAVERINKEIELRKSGKVDRTNDIILLRPADEKTKLELQKLKQSKGIK